MSDWDEQISRRERAAREQAQACADALRAFWLERGYDVRTWIVPDGQFQGAQNYGVRSSLNPKTALPQDWKGSRR